LISEVWSLFDQSSLMICATWVGVSIASAVYIAATHT
jgi:hypothetical protein